MGLKSVSAYHGHGGDTRSTVDSQFYILYPSDNFTRKWCRFYPVQVFTVVLKWSCKLLNTSKY